MPLMVYGEGGDSKTSDGFCWRVFLEYNGSHYNAMVWPSELAQDSGAQSMKRRMPTVYLKEQVGGAEEMEGMLQEVERNLMAAARRFQEANKHLAKTQNSAVEVEKEAHQIFDFLGEGEERMEMQHDERGEKGGKQDKKQGKKGKKGKSNDAFVVQVPADGAEWTWGRPIPEKLGDFGFEEEDIAALLTMVVAAVEGGQDSTAVTRTEFVSAYAGWKKEYNSKRAN
jgi:hypothetical protein